MDAQARWASLGRRSVRFQNSANPLWRHRAAQFLVAMNTTLPVQTSGVTEPLPSAMLESPETSRGVSGDGEVRPNTTGGLDAPRQLGVLDGAEPGPTLIVVGGIHGNEPAGVLGLVRLLEIFHQEGLQLPRGRLVALVGNRRALAVGQRYLQNDLNRHWLPERVQALRGKALDGHDLQDEDAELVELLEHIETWRQSSPRGEPVYLLDLHTFSAPGIAFSVLDDNLENRAFTLRLPVPAVLGLEEEVSGTLASYMSGCGVISAGYESGQHEAPVAVDRAVAALWVTLESAGLVTDGSMPRTETERRRLALECAHLPPIVEVRYRHHIETEDSYRMDAGWSNFQPVDRREALGRDRSGDVASPMNGLVLMPLYQKQGADGFFVVRPVHWRWLWLSALVRRIPVRHALHWLPGVRRHPELAETYLVDRRFARFFVLEVFHLLGFERRSPLSERVMVWTCRESPRPDL